MNININTAILALVFTLVLNLGTAQDLNFHNYAVGLSELVTYAENPGFKNTIHIENTGQVLNWQEGEDGYYFTDEIEYIQVFGYKVLYQSGDSFVVSVISDFEGTAVLTYILKVVTTKNSLVLKEIIGGGDRCHNAVLLDKIKVENEVLSYQTLITPDGFVNLFNTPRNKERFPNCMTCCMGFVTYSYNIKTGRKSFDKVMIIKEHLPGIESFIKTYDVFVKAEPIKQSLTLNQTEAKAFISAIEKMEQ